MSKELFISSWEEIYSKLVDGGCPEDMAAEIADEHAYDHMRDRLADMIDFARTRQKEHGE